MTESSGVLYVVVGRHTKRYLGEARRAVRSLHEQCPDVKSAIVVDRPKLVDAGTRKLFDLIIPMPVINVDDKLILSKRIVGLIFTPFERTLYLDTDTQVCGDVSDVFGVLDYYDMGMVYSVHRLWHKNLAIYGEDIPDWLPEFNGGVIVYHKSDVMIRLFTQWQQLHVRMDEWNDQMALRVVLWHCIQRYGLRIYPLPCEYGVWVASPQPLGMRVRVIHGRKGLLQMCKKINKSIGRIRLWMPHPVADLMDWKRFHRVYKGG